jgi:REP element-mobilizing transposase RayT
VNNGKVILSTYGKIVQQEIYNLEGKEIGIDACIIMPNHIHMIISIKENYDWGAPISSNVVETSIYGVSGAGMNNNQK